MTDDLVKRQKERERLFREKDEPFGVFTVRAKTRWWNEIELLNAYRFLEWKQGMSLLDVGTNDGRMLSLMDARDRHAFLVGMDLALTPLRCIRQRLPDVPVLAADAATVVFRPASFDRAVALQVIQQIASAEERIRAFRSILSALKESGVFVLTVLNRPSWAGLVANGKEGPLLSAPELQVYLYDEQELRADLKTAGFRVKTVKFINNLPVRYLRHLGKCGVGLDLVISDFFRPLSVTKGRYILAVCAKK